MKSARSGVQTARWLGAALVVGFLVGTVPAFAEDGHETAVHHGHKSKHKAAAGPHDAPHEAAPEPSHEASHETGHEVSHGEAHGGGAHGGGHEDSHGAHEAEGVAPGQVVSVFENIAEAAESTVAGGLFKFLELGPKLRDILVAHNQGDDATAVANSIGTFTEYGLAVFLFESLGIAELFMIDLKPGFDWMMQIAMQLGQGVVGTLGVTKVSEFSGEVVEKTTHQSLTGGHHDSGHGAHHGDEPKH